MAITAKRQQQLVGHLAKVARAFSRNWNVDVQFVGTKICNNGKTIFLPANADFLNDDQQHIMEGLLDHEWSHVAEETEAAESGGKIPSPLELMKQSTSRSNREGMFFNAFEDVRIERKQGAKYVGVGEHLAQTREYMTRVVTAKAALNPKADPWSNLACALIAAALDHDTSWAPKYVTDIMTHLADIPARARATRHAGETQALAQEVIQRVLDLNKGMEKDSSESGDLGAGSEAGEGAAGEEGEGSEGGEGEGGEGGEAGADAEGEGKDGAGAGEDDAEGNGEGEGKGESKDKGKGGKGSKEDKGEGEGGADESGDPSPGGGKGGGTVSKSKVKPKPFDATAHEMLEKMSETDAGTADLGDALRGEVEKAAKQDISRNGRHIPDPEALAMDTEYNAKPADVSKYNGYMDEVRGTVAGLRSRILAALRSRKQSWLQGDKEEGALDPDALHTVRLGNKRVFAEMTRGEGLDVAIGILIDQSGSMSSKVPMTRAATIALTECLAKLGLPFAVWGFDNAGSTGWGAGDTSLYNRFEGFRFEVYKNFEDKFAQVKTRLANIRSGGNNCDGEAVEWAALRLNARPEHRKILIVLSDGYPALGSSDGDKLNRHLKDVVRRVEAAGIECFGLGIQDNAVRKFYNDWAVVNKLPDLAPEMFRMLRKYLVQGKHSRDAKKLTAEFR